MKYVLGFIGFVVIAVVALFIVISNRIQKAEYYGDEAEKWLKENLTSLKPMGFEDRVRFALEQNDLKKLVEPVLALKRYAITFEPDIEVAAGVAASKIGGFPDLKDGETWPQYHDRKLCFLFQLNLGDLAAYDTEKKLPSNGLLLFFYDYEQEGQGDDAQDKGCWKVLYYPDIEGLKRTKTDTLFTYKESTLKLGKKPVLPASDADVYVKMKGNVPKVIEYIEVIQTMEQYGSNSYALGYPYYIQSSSMEYDCKRSAGGKLSDWVLLAQLNSEEKAGMMWGDTGMLYFWIKKEDLENRNFNDVWMVLQCS